MKFGILGGDFRYKFLQQDLTNSGYKVYTHNSKFIEDDLQINDIDDFFKNIDILITSIPFSKDKETVFNTKTEIKIDSLIEKILNSNVKTLFGGVIDKNITEKLANKNIEVVDFFEDNSIAIFNAVPTAEGAIQTAMENSYKTLFSSQCLVLGYGRCGKILSNMLKGMGANVDISYRKEEDLAYIKSYGFNAINLCNINESINKYDFIFNTIPFQILNKNLLSNVNKETVIIDLAQAPGGVDYEYASDLNLKAIYCPNLPARVAPLTASKILKDKISKVCNLTIG